MCNIHECQNIGGNSIVLSKTDIANIVLSIFYIFSCKTVIFPSFFNQCQPQPLIESAITPVRDFIMTINNSAASLLKDFRGKFDI